MEKELKEVMKFVKPVMYFDPQIKPVTYPGVVPDRYSVTEYGDVIDNWNNHLLPKYYNSSGYSAVSLQKTDPKKMPLTSIARVTAEAFHPNSDIRYTIDHVDGNKNNNHYTNLEWITIDENIRRSYTQVVRKPKENTSKLYNPDLPDYQPGMIISDEVIHKVCQLLQDTDYPFSKICYLAGTPNMKWNIARDFCNSILLYRNYYDIASQYDFSNRINNRVRPYTPEEKQKIHDLLSLEKMTYKELFELFYEGQKWEGQTVKVKDKFTHFVKREIEYLNSQSQGSSTNCSEKPHEAPVKRSRFY